MKSSDNGGDIYTVFTRDDLLTHATIYWTGNAIAGSIRTYADDDRFAGHPPTTDRGRRGTDRDHVRRLRGPPGKQRPEERVASFLASDHITSYNHVDIAAHPHGGHFIPWESRTMGRQPGPDLEPQLAPPPA